MRVFLGDTQPWHQRHRAFLYGRVRPFLSLQPCPREVLVTCAGPLSPLSSFKRRVCIHSPNFKEETHGPAVRPGGSGSCSRSRVWGVASDPEKPPVSLEVTLLRSRLTAFGFHVFSHTDGEKPTGVGVTSPHCAPRARPALGAGDVRRAGPPLILRASRDLACRWVCSLLFHTHVTRTFWERPQNLPRNCCLSRALGVKTARCRLRGSQSICTLPSSHGHRHTPAQTDRQTDTQIQTHASTHVCTETRR